MWVNEKTSTFSTTTTGATEAKRRSSSSFMEPTKAPQAAAPKKSRLDSRASCPPFKVMIHIYSLINPYN